MKKLLTGISANKGRVTGKVFVVKDKKDINNFKQNSILVARITDPSYLPAMVKSIGIITDMGGILSHPAILSREFGIPCVVGTKQATLILFTGQKTTLDANEGIIYADN